jgi:hypothetical protein
VLTTLNHLGSNESREHAKYILEFDVIEKVPQRTTQTTTIEKATVAPAVPKESIRICRTGLPAAGAMVASKSWMQKRKETRTKKPNTAEAATEIRTPFGALRAASCVSSDMCALASKPVCVYCATRILYRREQISNDGK